MISGYTKPLTSAQLEDKCEIIQTIALHYTLLQSIAEMDQLKKGLETLGVLQIIQDHQIILEPFFTAEGNIKLTAGMHLNFINILLCYTVVLFR